MLVVQLSIRAEMTTKGLHPLTAAAIFRVYSFPRGKGLTQEMESTSGLTPDFLMTFESMGDELATFEGWALRDLARYRKHCRDSLVLSPESLLDRQVPPSDIWAQLVARQLLRPQVPLGYKHPFRNISERCVKCSRSLLKPSGLQAEYLAALRSHVSYMGCKFCSKAHIMHGGALYTQVENILSNALDGVGLNKLSF